MPVVWYAGPGNDVRGSALSPFPRHKEVPLRLLVRWVITAIALFVAVQRVPGIRVAGDASSLTLYAAMAIVFGLVNALVRPILKLLSCPLILLTFGLFTLVVNAAAFWLSAWVAQQTRFWSVVGRRTSVWRSLGT